MVLSKTILYQKLWNFKFYKRIKWLWKRTHFFEKKNATDTQITNFHMHAIVLEQNIKCEDNLGAVASAKSQTSAIEEKGSYVDVIWRN